MLCSFSAAVRVGSINGQFIANPTRQQMQTSDLNLVVSVNQKGHLGKCTYRMIVNNTKSIRIIT
jgi:polyribonucleotide nucleotidyltransferase